MGPFKKKIVGKYYYKTHSSLMINVRLSVRGRVGRMVYCFLTEHGHFLDMQTFVRQTLAGTTNLHMASNTIFAGAAS